MPKIKKTFDWFKTKTVTASFAAIALLGAYFFLNKSVTGNVVLTYNPSVNLLSIIGLLLVLCSVILGAYSIKKK